MPRGLSSPIQTELGKTTFSGVFYYVRITVSPSSILRWGENQQTIGSETFTPRLQSVDNLQFAPDNTQQVSFTVSNVDGAITTLDQEFSFKGAKIELIEYLPDIDASFNAFVGWLDEIQSISAMSATFVAYPIVAIPGIQIPKRQLGLACTNSFGNTANWNSVRDFEGSECPYQRVSTIGFVATLSGAITNVATNFTAQWTSGQVTAGAKFQKGDRIKIGSEEMLITVQPSDPDGSFQQFLTVQRAVNGTSPASHSDTDTIFFNNCGFAVADCTRRGMYGNNTSDTYTA